MRVESWLREHAPSIPANLPKGAADDELPAVESRLSVQFPEDFRESYRLHNGSGEVALFGFQSYSLEYIATDWEGQQILVGDDQEPPIVADGPIREETWNAAWIPVGGNQCGDYLILDLAPAPGGAFGQLFWWDHEGATAKIQANGWREFMTRFAAELEAGRYYVYDHKGSQGLAWQTLPEEERPIAYRIILQEIGPRRMEVLRTVHQVFNIPLAEAKMLLSLERPVLGTIRWYERPEYQERFDALGAAIQFEPAQRSNHAQGIRSLMQGRPSAAD